MGNTFLTCDQGIPQSTNVLSTRSTGIFFTKPKMLILSQQLILSHVKWQSRIAMQIQSTKSVCRLNNLNFLYITITPNSPPPIELIICYFFWHCLFLLSLEFLKCKSPAQLLFIFRASNLMRSVHSKGFLLFHSFCSSVSQQFKLKSFFRPPQIHQMSKFYSLSHVNKI